VNNRERHVYTYIRTCNYFFHIRTVYLVIVKVLFIHQLTH